MFCVKCGAQLREDAMFCHKCGTRIQDEEDIRHQSKHSFDNGMRFPNGIDVKKIFKGFTPIMWKAGTVLVAMFVIGIVTFLISLILSSAISTIVVIAGGYIVYQKWIAKYIVRSIYNKSSKRLQLPKGMTAQTLLEFLNGRFNYPYFNGARYGNMGECLINGKHFTYAVIFAANDSVYLACNPNFNDKKYCTILREAIVICKYINNFFNPAHPVDVAKDLKALKSAEGQQKRTVIVLSAAAVFLVIAIATQGGSSSSVQRRDSDVTASSVSLDKALCGRWRTYGGDTLELDGHGTAATVFTFWGPLNGKPDSVTWKASNGCLTLSAHYSTEQRWEIRPRGNIDGHEAVTDELFLRDGDIPKDETLGEYYREHTGNEGLSGVWKSRQLLVDLTLYEDGTGMMGKHMLTWEADETTFYCYPVIEMSYDYIVSGDTLTIFFSDGSRTYVKVGD